MQFSKLPSEVQDAISLQAFNCLPICLSEVQRTELETLNSDGLWQLCCEWAETDQCQDLHDAHDAIYTDTTALDILDKVWMLVQKYPPPNFNVPFANILLTSGRKEECLAYITKFVEG